MRTTYLSSRKHDIEISMKEEDARLCYHQGVCDDDVKSVCQMDYIKQQLAVISSEALEEVLVDYGCEFDENDRTDMEELVVWLAAGNILEDIAEEKATV